MPRKQLTKDEKRKIIKQVLKKGYAVSDVAKKLKRDPRTIYYIVNKARTVGKESVDRRLRFSHTDKKRVMRLSKKDPSRSAACIKEKLALGVSVSTIDKYLRKNPDYECRNTHQPVRTHKSRICVGKVKNRKVLGHSDKRAIDALVDDDENITSREILDRLDLHISKSTVCDYLREKHDCDNVHLPDRMRT